MTIIDTKSSINDKFFKKFKEELDEKVIELFKDVRKGNIESTMEIIKTYPIPTSVK